MLDVLGSLRGYFTVLLRLRQMVRVLVGTVMWDACGNPWVWSDIPELAGMRPSSLLTRLSATHNRTFTAPPAPPNGLALASVDYGNDDYEGSS